MSQLSHSGFPPEDPPRELVRQIVREVAAELVSKTPAPTPDWSLPSRYLAPAIQITQQAKRAAPVPSEPARRVMRPSPDGVRVAIGSDHGGFDLKRQLCEMLRERGYVPVDVGTHDRSSCDYPDYACKVGEAVLGGKATLGIMIDGAGIGSAMVLNKMRGIRAATVHSEATAVNSRAHNDANVLVLGSAQMHAGHARRITRIWLSTDHEGGRHARRVDKINLLDQARP